MIYKISGLIGVIGCIAVLAGDVIGIIVHEKHDPISDTISMLAIGKYGWIQDWGLDIFALGCMALAIGLFSLKSTGGKWLFSLLLLVFLGVNILLIAEHNQYAGRPGENIHRTLVYILAGLFLMLNILISYDINILRQGLKKFSRWVAFLWLILAPLLPLIPDNWDGAYERVVCLLLVVWSATVAYYLLKRGAGENGIKNRDVAAK